MVRADDALEHERPLSAYCAETNVLAWPSRFPGAAVGRRAAISNAAHDSPNAAERVFCDSSLRPRVSSTPLPLTLSDFADLSGIVQWN